jgi:DNA-binding winged helix-turn-helix (wHTH) protein
MLTSRRQFLLIVCALIAVIAGGMATAFSVQFADTLENQFNVRAELYARTVSDQVKFRLTQISTTDEASVKGAMESLLRDRVRGDVIYAQVVNDGIVLAEERTYVVPQEQFRIEEDEQPLVFSKNRMLSGESYLDVRRALVSSPNPIDPGSYIRLGFSLENLQQTVFGQTLQSALWGIVGALGGIGLLLVAYKIWQPATHLNAAASATAAVNIPTQEAITVDASPPLLASSGNHIIHCGDILIDDEAKQVCLKDEEVLMSPREYELLKLLCEHPGKIFSNADIVKQVWQDDQFAMPQDVKKYVYLLRKKLEDDPSKPKRLLTVRGFGYKLMDSTA